MVKEVDLLAYWMPVLRELREFRELAKAEEPELRYLLEACDRTLSNFYISTADEYGISRFEHIMGIIPEIGEDLESRRFTLLAKWNDKVPYTDKELYNRLLSLCGSKDRFKILPEYDKYKLGIETEVGIKGAFDAITSLIMEMIPCNLVLTLKNFLREEKTTPLCGWVTLSTAMTYQITHDIDEAYLGDSPLRVATGVSRASTHTVTHDISSVAQKTSLLSEAIGVGIAHTTLITNDLESKAVTKGNSTVASPISTATVITN